MTQSQRATRQRGCAGFGLTSEGVHIVIQGYTRGGSGAAQVEMGSR